MAARMSAEPAIRTVQTAPGSARSGPQAAGTSAGPRRYEHRVRHGPGVSQPATDPAARRLLRGAGALAGRSGAERRTASRDVSPLAGPHPHHQPPPGLPDESAASSVDRVELRAAGTLHRLPPL